MPRIAVLNTDPQNGFGHPTQPELPVPYGYEVVTPINTVVSYGRNRGWAVVWSGDQHPFNTSHFKPEGLWDRHCVRGTWGAQFLAGLDTRREDAYISKAMKDNEDGYSPLCENAFVADGRTALQYLDDEGIEVLVVTGLATDYCVKAGVLHGIACGKKVYLVTDAIRAVNFFTPDDGQKALDEMVAAGAILITSEQLDQVA